MKNIRWPVRLACEFVVVIVVVSVFFMAVSKPAGDLATPSVDQSQFVPEQEQSVTKKTNEMQTVTFTFRPRLASGSVDSTNAVAVTVKNQTQTK